VASLGHVLLEHLLFDSHGSNEPSQIRIVFDLSHG
jgi:hypothetical protein